MHPEARERLRAARLEIGVSLRELGRRLGVSASLLSQIENGKSDPSVSTLYALVTELGLSLDALLGPGEGAGAVPNADAVDAADSPDAPETPGSPDAPEAARGDAGGRRRRSPVVRPGERRILRMDSGVTWERLTRGPSELIDGLLVTYEPGGTSSSSGELMTHSGQEHAYLIAGELTLQLGFETYVIKAGDSLEFEASTPHLYRNAGLMPAIGVWCVVGKPTVPAHDATGAGRAGRPAAEAGAFQPASAVDVLKAFSQD